MKQFALLFIPLLVYHFSDAQVYTRTTVSDTQAVKARIITTDRNTIKPPPEQFSLDEQVKKNLQTIADKYKGLANDSITWTKMKVDAYNYLYGLWTAKRLQGIKVSEAFFVKTGKEIMTQQEIVAGKKIIQAGYAQFKPAEFTILRLEAQ